MIGRQRRRRCKGKRCQLMIGVCLFGLIMSSQSMAAQSISSVSLSVSEEIEVGDDTYGDTIEIETGSNRYYVDAIEVLNENLTWGPLDTPVIQVTLQAEPEYIFAVGTADISVRGAEYISGRRTEDSDCLLLVLRLPSLADQVGEISQAQWSDGTIGTWDAPYNAGTYEVYLYRDGKSAGSWRNVTGNACDFGSKMIRPGTYSFKVRAVNAKDQGVKSEWKEAVGTVTVDQTMAEQLRSRYGLVIPEGLDGPGEAAAYLAQKNIRYGWNQDHVGWWYCNADGSYTTSNWQLIEGKWYYFDSVGYMVTGWIDWNGNSYYCDPVSGEMLADTVVPDGSGRRVDSSGAWIQ